MKTNGTRYSPAFKFQVVLEALKAEGKDTEAQVAPGLHSFPGCSRSIQ